MTTKQLIARYRASQRRWAKINAERKAFWDEIVRQVTERA